MVRCHFFLIDMQIIHSSMWTLSLPLKCYYYLMMGMPHCPQLLLIATPDEIQYMHTVPAFGTGRVVLLPCPNNVIFQIIYGYYALLAFCHA